MKVPFTSIHLGDRVRDKVTGFEGIAVSCSEYLTGQVRVVIEGKAGDTGTGDMISVDWQLLELVEKGAVEYSGVPDFEYPFALGDRVVCKLTQSKGVATEFSHFLNVGITRKPKKGQSDFYHNSWQYFELVEKGVFSLKTEAAPAKKVGSGGPSVRMSRAPVARS